MNSTPTSPITKPTAEFSLDVLCHSDTAIRMGIKNVPDAKAQANLRILAAKLLEVRTYLGKALTINSGFRNKALNKAVGGVPDSQHLLGLAADFLCPAYGSPIEVAQAIAKSALQFDQLILEYGRWVHISVAADPNNMRHEVLTIWDKSSGYQTGIVAEPTAPQ